MNSIDPSAAPAFDRAAARLSRSVLAPLVEELARRYSEGAEAEPVRVSLRGLSLDSRRALADLLGSDRLPAADLRVAVDRLCAALGLPADASLRPVITRLRGPLDDKRARRAAEQLARDELWSWFAARAGELDLGQYRLDGWVSAVRAGGIRGGEAAFRTRLQTALQVLQALPADGVSLPSFANDHAGGPHALDHGSALSTLVLDAVAYASGQERASDAGAARGLWESVGVVPDPYSSTVLALGLPGDGGSPLGQWLAATSGAGEPVVLALAHLRHWTVQPLPREARLYVVENPSLIVEAAATNWTGPPIVCSSGRPTVAVVTLLAALTAAGAAAFQHADFDAAGLSITQWLAQRANTIPWRMGAADYTAYRARGRRTIGGAIPQTPWDPDLQQLLEQHRRPVYEEQVRAELITAIRAAE